MSASSWRVFVARSAGLRRALYSPVLGNTIPERHDGGVIRGSLGPQMAHGAVRAIEVQRLSHVLVENGDSRWTRGQGRGLIIERVHLSTAR